MRRSRSFASAFFSRNGRERGLCLSHKGRGEGRPAFGTGHIGFNFKQQGANDCKIVIASEAKQSIGQQERKLDCFVASLLAMTL
jgi:hypothetical protein